MSKPNSCIKRPETFTYIQVLIYPDGAPFCYGSNIDEVSEFLNGSRYKAYIDIFGNLCLGLLAGHQGENFKVQNLQYIVLSSNGIASVYSEEEFNLIFEPK